MADISTSKMDNQAVKNDTDQKDGESPTEMKSSDTTVRQERNGDPFSLKVKPEFVLTSRPSSLGPLPVSESHDDRDNNGNGGENDDREFERNDDDRGGGNRKKKKKNRGQNKKRPRDTKQDMGEKLCMAVMKGDPCPREAAGEECRFSHDLEGFMKTRPTDISELGEGCPNYSKSGYCPYGAMCRFGSTHIDKSGKNMRKEAACATATSNPTSTTTTKIFNGQQETDIMNHLPRGVAMQLRKKKYPFKCKRHFEEKADKTEEAKNTEKDDPMTNGAETSAPADSPGKTESSTTPSSTSASSPTPVEKPTKKKLVDFSNKVYVAPLTTVGNLPFRRIMKGYGADITCGEMAVVPNLLQGQQSEWALLKRHPSEDVFGVQLAAAHPDQYTRVSELIEKYCEVDFVDLNLGCPLDILCNKGAGAALMMRERKLKPILRGMSQMLQTSCITVKMRTGWDMDKPFAHNLVPKIQSWGVDGIAAVMVHGRSRLQRYKLDANWDYISQVANSESNDHPIPIIGNGDIFSYKDYEEKVLAHPNLCPTAMLGRGALIKPWLPTEIKEKRDWDISSSERMDMLKSFVRYGLEHWGSDQEGVNKTRRFLLEFLSFLCRYVPVGLLEVLPQKMNMRPPLYMMGRNDLETLFLSQQSSDWVKISEMLLGPVASDFKFEPKHKAKGYVQNG